MKSKNVLIVIPHLGVGGTEIQTLNTVRALVLGGYKVTVLCLFRHIASVVADYENCGAKVYCACPQYNNFGIAIAYPKHLKLFLFLYKHLKEVIKRERIDIFHVQYLSPASSVILVLRFLLFQRNIIVTSHTMADIYKNLSLVHFIQKHCARVFTCITERAERSFFGTSQLYTPDLVLGRRNHFTIYNSLPVQLGGSCNEDENENFCSQLTAHRSQSQFSSSLSSSSQKEPSAPFVLGVVSRLEPIKGMDLVVPAFAEVLKAYPETQLLVVGDGTLRASMEEQAAQLACTDHIRFVGRQPQEELSQWYSQMDIVLMPSRSEGFGLTAIEAMAHGCVMVASDVGGLPEVVRDGICGLLHRTEDVADMASKICSLIGDNDLYNKLRTQSLVEVGKYSFERYASAVCDLYERLIAIRDCWLMRRWRG